MIFYAIIEPVWRPIMAPANSLQLNERERVDRVSIQHTHTHHRHCDDAQSGANGIFSFSSPFYYLPRSNDRDRHTEPFKYINISA